MPRRRVPRAALLFALVVGITELAFWTSTDPLIGAPLLQPTMDDAVVAARHRMIAKAAGAVVLVGDSSCLMGLVPDEVTRTLGQPVLNLGTLASFSMAGFATLAEETMQADPQPLAIVFVVLPHAIQVTAEQVDEDGLLGRYLLAYGLSSEQYQPSCADWRRWVFNKHRFNILSPRLGGSFDQFCQRLDETGGWLPEVGEYRGTTTPRSNFVPGALATDALRGFVAKAEKKGIPVCFWWAPSPADAYEAAYPAAAHAQVLGIQSAAPWLKVLQACPPTWDDGKFATVTHLTPSAAAEHSQLFGTSLRRSLNARGSAECCEGRGAAEAAGRGR
jgi:hypothetical protein